MSKIVQAIQNESPESIVSVLETYAYETDEMSYSRALTDEEVAKKKEDYVQLNIKYKAFKDQLDNIREEYKQKMKPIETLSSELLVQLKNKKVDEEGIVYAIDDQDEKMMYYMTKTGEVISARPLLPQERQLSINSNIAANE